MRAWNCLEIESSRATVAHVPTILIDPVCTLVLYQRSATAASATEYREALGGRLQRYYPRRNIVDGSSGKKEEPAPRAPRYQQAEVTDFRCFPLPLIERVQYIQLPPSIFEATMLSTS